MGIILKGKTLASDGVVHTFNWFLPLRNELDPEVLLGLNEDGVRFLGGEYAAGKLVHSPVTFLTYAGTERIDDWVNGGGYYGVPMSANYVDNSPIYFGEYGASKYITLRYSGGDTYVSFYTASGSLWCDLYCLESYGGRGPNYGVRYPAFFISFGANGFLDDFGSIDTGNKGDFDAYTNICSVKRASYGSGGGSVGIQTNNRTLTELFELLQSWFGQTSTDPYQPGGESDTGGGTGDFDGSSDSIGIPDLPSGITATATGFVTLYNPSLGEIQNLAAYMWTDSFYEAILKLWADPMDAILGLSIVPVAVPDGGSRTVVVGNVSTPITMNAAAAQYVAVDCGTLNINEYWGSYLDYEPFTKAEIYLPYIGTHPISVDDIMNKSVHVVYHVDILSGACIAYVQCGGSVLYSFTGQCAAQVPVTSSNWNNIISGAISIAGSIGSMIASGGMSAPIAVNKTAALANTATQMKPSIERSGSLSGAAGLMAIQKPYIILTRPRQCLPAQTNKIHGYPSYITRQLSSLSGWTVIDEVHLENIPATEPEKDEILQILQGGVIL